MKIRLLILILLLFSIKSLGQTYEWTKTFGGEQYDQMESIVSDVDGNTYSTGGFVGIVDFDPGPGVFNLSAEGGQYDYNVFVQKLDPQGNFIWAKSIPGVNYDDGRDITIDSSGNVIVVGRSEISGMSDNSIIFKLDPLGNIIFSKMFGNNVQDYLACVAIDPFDNIYTLGQFQNTMDVDPSNSVFNLNSEGSTDIYIQKLNNNGDFIWAKSIGGNGLDLARHLNIDSFGNLYISGFFEETCDFDPDISVSTMTSIGLWDGFILKLNNDGELIWHKGFGGLTLDDSSSSSVDSDGNVVVTGFFEGTVDFNPNSGVFNLTSNGLEDIYILKLDVDGNFLWANSFGTQYYDYGMSVDIDNIGEIYLTGGLFKPENWDPNLFTTDYDVFIHKYDTDGNLLWDYKFGGPDTDFGHAIHIDNFYNIYVAGIYFETVDFNPEDRVEDIFETNGGGDVFVTKYSQSIDAPIAYPLIDLVSCADVSNNGFSNNFDTTNIENQVLGDQTGMLVSYFDEVGNELPSPLPNPFTNTEAYNQSITVIVTDSNTLLFSETTLELSVISNPIAYQPDAIYSCDEGNGFADFDTTNIEEEILGGQSGLEILYFDQAGNELTSPLPNPLQNTLPNTESILVRVYYDNNDTCYTELSFELIIKEIPEVFEVNDLYICDNDDNGFEIFDLSNIEYDLLGNQSNFVVEYFSSDDVQIPLNLLPNYQNIIENEDFITVKVYNETNDCFIEVVIFLYAENLFPIANSVDILYGCDDNNDGISEYFDTSSVDNQIINNQTDVETTYFTTEGIELTSPLANPFTNTESNFQNIIARITNLNSGCYSETILEFQTLNPPIINQPNDLFSCDQGQGFAEFDTSLIEEQIIGNQTGLLVYYYDSNFNELSSPLPQLFTNSDPYSEIINVKVEYESNPQCYSETTFNLVVNELPIIDLENEYSICFLNPSITLALDSSYNSYKWVYEDGTVISTNHIVELVDEGSYALTISNLENNLLCEVSHTLNLNWINAPEIEQINHGVLGETYIEIITVNDGNFEYSIDGFYYQESNYFENIIGGTITVYVRDKNGCGEALKEITILYPPKFFTPNNDDYNDYWHVIGMDKYPNSKVFVYDRYGKLLKILTENDLGWDGLYNGNKMYSTDYWFKAELGNGLIFSGHFSLKR